MFFVWVLAAPTALKGVNKLLDLALDVKRGRDQSRDFPTYEAHFDVLVTRKEAEELNDNTTLINGVTRYRHRHPAKG